MSEDQQHLLANLARRGTIVYAIKYRSQLDFVSLSLCLHQLKLPSPSFLFELHPYLWQPRWYALKILGYHLYHFIRQGALPNPYDNGYFEAKIRSKQCGLFFLLGKKGYYRRTVFVGNDPLEHLLKIQEKWEEPIFVVPLVLLYSRHPVRERRGLLDIFLGHKEQPGLLRKTLSLFRGYSDAVLEVGEPLDLQCVLPELSEIFGQRRKQIFELRRELIDSVDKIKRAIIGPTLKSKLELKEIILHHPRLEAFMQRRARSRNQEIWKVRMEADKYLEEIAANYNYTLIQLTEKVLDWTWNNLFSGIEVDNESLQKVKQAARHSTLVYVPCHKSHTDYMILSSILFQSKLSLPFIAAGKNLAFWPLGPFFRRGGAFFIRRSFKGLKFYAEVFSLYVKTLVQLGHNIEFFIEGGRSRTGKMVLPKLGLLAILIQAVEEGFCEDLVFVPTSICYDRIPEEESYLTEVSGGIKVQENIGQLVRARRFLKKRYGRVYVQFAEPLSLQQYLQRYGGDFSKLRSKDRHALYRDFAYRIINSINQASRVTPHALAASALLASSRRGVSLAEFQEICGIFHDYLMETEAQLSNNLRNYDALIEETLRDFERSKLIGKLKDEDDDLEEQVFTIEDSKRLALEYYKNNLIHFLLSAAFVSSSILAQRTFSFSRAQLLEDVAFLKDFFKFEFVYDNEIENDELMDRVLGSFEDLGWLHRMSKDDEPYVLAHQGQRAAHYFHGLLQDYFEGYWLVLRACRYLQKKPYAESHFIKKVSGLGQKALKLELIERPEAISNIMFLNAIKYYLEKGVIEKRSEDEKGKEREQEFYWDAGNRLLIQHYSRQISRFLRSPHFVLQ
ncbi:MAG TPA: 1-acyl-sn-glycerol-3-phosphate acyltransferase [Syntrophobacteraceae bacterium]|nr:1-acyl-sn-glycerol-3-phosphate acyltransferase [Syntrophobacteraceae bacterium]